MRVFSSDRIFYNKKWIWIGSIVSIGCLFLFVFFDNFILLALPIVVVLLFGFWISRLINVEVKQDEEINILNKNVFQAGRKLNKLDRAKSEFITIASHQLRTPLTSIKGFTSLLLDGTYGDISPQIKEVAEKIYLSNDRLSKLVEDLLNVARIEAGDFVFRFEKNSIEETAKEAFDSLAIQAKAKKIDFHFLSLQSSIQPFCFDKMKIKEALINLIDNAIKYTPSGKVTVLVEERGKKVRISVVDTGIGIAREEIHYVFEKFQRGIDVQSIHTEGIGMGLYVCGKIIKAHEGRIWVESEGKNRGSRFIIELKKDFEPTGSENERKIRVEFDESSTIDRGGPFGQKTLGLESAELN